MRILNKFSGSTRCKGIHNMFPKAGGIGIPQHSMSIQFNYYLKPPVSNCLYSFPTAMHQCAYSWSRLHRAYRNHGELLWSSEIYVLITDCCFWTQGCWQRGRQLCYISLDYCKPPPIWEAKHAQLSKWYWKGMAFGIIYGKLWPLYSYCLCRSAINHLGSLMEKRVSRWEEELSTEWRKSRTKPRT